MTGQNDRPDECLTGQAHDQAGHCPLTGRYFEPFSVLMVSIFIFDGVTVTTENNTEIMNIWKPYNFYVNCRVKNFITCIWRKIIAVIYASYSVRLVLHK